MELKQGECTFADYANINICIDTIREMYEQYRADNGQGTDDYQLDQLWLWLDKFHQIAVFVFDKEIARYKRYTHSTLKELFISQIRKLVSGEKPQNGIGKTVNNHDDEEEEEEEDWD